MKMCTMNDLNVCYCSICVVGLVYIVGGLNEMNAELQSVDIYNPVTERWTRASDMQTKRAYVGVAAVNGFIYAVGGWNEKDGALSTVERYSPIDVSYPYTCIINIYYDMKVQSKIHCDMVL